MHIDEQRRLPLPGVLCSDWIKRVGIRLATWLPQLIAAPVSSYSGGYASSYLSMNLTDGKFIHIASLMHIMSIHNLHIYINRTIHNKWTGISIFSTCEGGNIYAS